MAVGFLAPTHIPIRLVSDYRACFASASIPLQMHRRELKGRSAEGPERARRDRALES
jgi:hypothetical protein